MQQGRRTGHAGNGPDERPSAGEQVTTGSTATRANLAAGRPKTRAISDNQRQDPAVVEQLLIPSVHSSAGFRLLLEQGVFVCDVMAEGRPRSWLPEF
jgi:hypothetical protein